MRAALLGVTILLQAAAVAAKATELTEADFDSTLAARSGVWLLKFYAPWCGHCKHLAPLWDQAAEQVAAEGLPVHFGKMDCTVRAHNSICSRYKTSGYPSLRVITPEGKLLKNYRGGRDAEGIISYAKLLSQPAFKNLNTTKEVKDFIDRKEEEKGAGFVLFRPEEPSEEFKELEAAFLAAARQESDVTELAIAPEYTGDDLGIPVRLDGKTLQDDDGLGGKLVVFREGQGKCLSSHINRTEDQVAHWVSGHRFIMMPKITASNYRALGDRGKPLVMVLLRGSRKKNEDGTSPPVEKIPINAEYLAAMKAVARELEDDFAFGYLDGKEWEKFITKYGASTRVLPRLLIMDLAREYYLPVPVDVKGHDATVEYLNKAKSGEVRWSRSFETLVKESLELYKWQMLAGLVVVIAIPLLWMAWTDYADKKRAATYAKQSETKENKDKDGKKEQ